MLIHYFFEDEIGWFKLHSNLIDKADIKVGIFDLAYLLICPIDQCLGYIDAFEVGMEEG
jgi:hypothetical protein